jgi:hypothetical protein
MAAIVPAPDALFKHRSPGWPSARRSGTIGLCMRPRLRVWATFGDDFKFGDGRARLLALIEEHGSLRQAADEFGLDTAMRREFERTFKTRGAPRRRAKETT